MSNGSENPQRYVDAIRRSKLTIYDPIEVGDPLLWIPTPELEKLLNSGLAGISLTGLPLRTRSKVVKEHVCRSLGYPVPSSFRKIQPRFWGQCLDTYTQKSNNLQVWNEELSPIRRYAIIRVNEDDVIIKVKVVNGDDLAKLDTTGTLTQKYQARLICNQNLPAELIAAEDTDRLQEFVCASNGWLFAPTPGCCPFKSPVDYPQAGQLLPIGEIFVRLQSLVGEQFQDIGYDQERNRGAALHALICQKLGYKDYRDDGRFPDIRHQLLEVKLQTSPTIDLGLVCPDSQEILYVPKLAGQQIRHCDVRYALFYAVTDGKVVTLTHLYLTTGEKFFTRFPQFGGKVLNKKLQIPLPADFFED